MQFRNIYLLRHIKYGYIVLTVIQHGTYTSGGLVCSDPLPTMWTLYVNSTGEHRHPPCYRDTVLQGHHRHHTYIYDQDKPGYDKTTEIQILIFISKVFA